MTRRFETRPPRWFAGVFLTGTLLASPAWPQAEPPTANAPTPRATVAAGTLAQVTTGLAFAVTITNGGRSFSGDTFDLRVPGANGPLRLSLQQLTLENRTLHAVASLENRTGGTLGGLRLDATGLLEPIVFGDLPAGQSSSGMLFRVSPVDLAPDSVVVMGVVSGLFVSGTVDVPDLRDVAGADHDAEGHLLLVDGAGRRVLRTDFDGTGAAEVARFPTSPIGVAADRRTGDVYVSCDGSPSLFRVATRRRTPSPVDAPRALGSLRTDGNGALFAASGSSLLKFGERAADSPPARLRTPGPVASFDAGETGRLLVVAGFAGTRKILKVEDGRTVRPLEGAGGAFPNATACRFAPGGLYVLEIAAGPVAGRLVVLDDAGRLVRETRILGDGDADLVPGKDGRLFAVSRTGPARITVLRAF